MIIAKSLPIRIFFEQVNGRILVPYFNEYMKYGNK